MNGKTIAIIAHITWIGWIIALIINYERKDQFAAFYIRQLLGLYLAGLVFSLIPLLGWMVSLVVFAFWIYSLINAAQGDVKEVPIVGVYFQQWFRTI